MTNLNSVFFSLLMGIFPALLWLWFWLKEDRLHPEPRRLVVLTFVAGMAVVILALPAEQMAQYFLKRIGMLKAIDGFLILFLWALIEEAAKYFAARKAALKQKEFDEPVDALIYLITAALGFAAAENVIFLAQISGNYGLLSGFITGNLRFVGATVLHILSSATVGASVAFCFFHKENYKRNLLLGLFFATLLHAFFNYFIIKGEGEKILETFAPFWFLVIVLLLVFEKVKHLKTVKQ